MVGLNQPDHESIEKPVVYQYSYNAWCCIFSGVQELLLVSWNSNLNLVWRSLSCLPFFFNHYEGHHESASPSMDESSKLKDC